MVEEVYKGFAIVNSFKPPVDGAFVPRRIPRVMPE